MIFPRSRPARSRSRAAAAPAALVALAACLIAGCSSSGGGSTGTSAPPAPAGSGSVSGPAAGSTTPSGAPSGTTSSAPGSSSSTAGPAAVHQKLTNFRIVDVTFVGSQAWALGSADCLSGKGTCDAVEYSGDDGRTWRSAPAPKANIQGTPRPDCAKPCVQHIRFATDRVGYAYGHDAFFTTADGGSTWTNRASSAEALESLDGNVIRVRATSSGCPPGCAYRVETAPVGSTAWHHVTLPGPAGRGDAALLVRTGARAFFASLGNPAGGANDERSVLWRSRDDGATWKYLAEPCIQYPGREYDTAMISTAPNGTLALLCSPRGGSSSPYVVTSSDAGDTFRAGSRTALGAAPISALAAGSSTVVLVSSDDTYRSTDGGRHFARLSADAGSSPGQLASLGFASATLVHGVSLDHRSLWTSHDAGRSWTRHRFS